MYNTMNYEQFKDKYPHWFTENGEYINGSLENQIQRIKELILDEVNHQLIGNKYKVDIDSLRIELLELQGMSQLNISKLKKLEEISNYDTSSNVNSLVLNGNNIWLDRDLRVSLERAILKEKEAGQSTTTLWYKGQCFQLKIEQALQMLSELELYALKCYNVTQQHLVNISNLTSIKEVEEYNYKENYPEKLNFDSK